MIIKILTQKEEELLSKGDPLSVEFTVPEINILSDENQLISLKLSVDFPEEFTPSDDLFSCAKKIIEGGSVYRTLEFCMLKNRVLESSITSVFSQMRRK